MLVDSGRSNSQISPFGKVNKKHTELTIFRKKMGRMFYPKRAMWDYNHFTKNQVGETLYVTLNELLFYPFLDFTC